MKMLKQARWLAFAVILAVAAAAVPFLDAPQFASYAASSRLKAPQNVKAVSADAHAIRISWKKVKQAKGYMVYRYDSGSKKYKEIKTLSANKKKWTNQGLTTDKIYKYKVRAYKTVKGKKKLGKLSYSVSAKPQTKDSKVKNVRRVYISAASEVYPGYKGGNWSTVLAGGYDENVKPVSEKLVWSSSNPKVLKVGKNGNFRALKTGKAYLIARAHNGVQARCKIKVYGYSAYINGKKISLGEKISSLNKKFGKPYYGNFNDTMYGEIAKKYGVSIDKRIKIYVYGTSAEQLTVIGINGRVQAYAATDAANFNLQGIRNGDTGKDAIKKKLKKLWSEVECFNLTEWGEGAGYYYMGSNDEWTADVIVDATGGSVCGIAVGGEDCPADMAYEMIQ